MKYYLSGPMSGIKDFNAPSFIIGAAILRAEGHEVWSPYEHDKQKFGRMKSKNGNPEDIPGLENVMDDIALADMEAVIRNQGIALLPNWEYSGGCLSEWSLAKWRRRKFRYFSQEELDRFEKNLWFPVKAMVLRDA